MKLVADGDKSKDVLSDTEKDSVEKELKRLRHIRDVLDVKSKKATAPDSAAAEEATPPKPTPAKTPPAAAPPEKTEDPPEAHTATNEPAEAQSGSPDSEAGPARPHTAKDIYHRPEPAAQPAGAKAGKTPKASKASKPGKATPRTKPEAPAPESPRTAGDAPQPEPAAQPAGAKAGKTPKASKASKPGKATPRTKPEAPAPEPPKSADKPAAAPAPDEPEKLPAGKPAPAKKSKKTPSPVRITAKKSVRIKPAKPGDAEPADKPQPVQEPKKIPVKKPAPKKTAAKPGAKKAKKTSLIKSAKTPKKRKSASNVPNTLEDELAIQLTPEEIDSFQIEKVDMEKLTHKVCDILLRCESEGMLQADLYKKLKLSARNGARLSLKLESMGMVNRVKLLVDERWTYKLILKKTPVSTTSLENAPCLVCPVEQKCSVDGDISPKTCALIEEWVIADLKRRP